MKERFKKFVDFKGVSKGICLATLLMLTLTLVWTVNAMSAEDFNHSPSTAPPSVSVESSGDQEATSGFQPVDPGTTPEQSPIIKRLNQARERGDDATRLEIEAMLAQPRVIGEDAGESATSSSNAFGGPGDPRGTSAGMEAAFGTDIIVRNFDSMERNQSMISDSSGNLYVAIETDLSGYYYIQIYWSSNGGDTWTAYGYVLSSNTHLTQPSIAVGEGIIDRLVVAYIVDDGTNIPHPEVAFSPLGVNSWTIVPISYVSFWNSYNSPVLWTDSYDWSGWYPYLTCEASYDGTTNTNVSFWRSLDQGATFSSEYVAWGNYDTDNWQDPDGTYGTTLNRVFIACFNNTDKNLYALSSDDYGNTWNSQVQVGVDSPAWEDPSHAVDPDIEAATGHDNVMVAFTRGYTSGTFSDCIGQTYSTDAGTTFPRSRWVMDGSDYTVNEFAPELTANEGGGSWHLAYTRSDWFVRYTSRPQDLSGYWSSTHDVVNDINWASAAYPKKGIASNWGTDVVGIAWADYRPDTGGDYDTFFDYDRGPVTPPDINVIPNIINMTESESEEQLAENWIKREVSEAAASGIVKVGEEVTEAVEAAYPFEKTGLVWERTFSMAGASYISIHFADFNLPDGDYMEISSPDGQRSHIYEGKGKVVRGGEAVLSTFWASHIPGDMAIVKIFGTNTEAAAPFGVHIDKWAYGYPEDVVNPLLNALENEIEAICSSDDKEWAPCYSGTTMYDRGRAVARLLINGSGACTGWLLGSEGHLMTNEHCISDQATADNTDYEFMAEGATCGTDCTGWFACPGTVAATSGTLVQDDASLDYALVLLPTNVSGIYGYLQLRNALPTVGERIYIPQHPGAKGKQLAVVDDTAGGANASVYSTDEPPCAGGPGDIGYYADTEGGSSGSPVLAYDDHLVVALHHCAYCPNRGVPIPAIISDLGANLPNDAIGGAVSDCFTIQNTGGSTLNVTSMGRRDGDAWLSWSPNAPFSIPPGGSQQVCVSINWNLVPGGGDGEQIIIYSNDPDENPYPDGVYVNATPAGSGYGDELAVDIGGLGLWDWDGTSWTGIYGGDAQGLASWSNGLAVDLGGSGLWNWNGTTWTLLYGGDVQGSASWSNGLAVDIGSSGLWNWDGTTWTLLYGGNVEDMTGWSNGIALDIGVSGFWNWDGTTWTLLYGGNVQGSASWSNGIAVDIGGSGLWNWDGTTWTLLYGGDVQGSAGWSNGIAVDIGVSGLWNWDGTTWTLLYGGNVENMTGWSNGIAVDIGGSGLWNWDGTSWTLIYGGDVENIEDVDLY